MTLEEYKNALKKKTFTDQQYYEYYCEKAEPIDYETFIKVWTLYKKVSALANARQAMINHYDTKFEINSNEYLPVSFSLYDENQQLIKTWQK